MALILATPRWRLVDRLLAGYGIVVALIGATRWTQRAMLPLIAAHVALAGLAWLAVRAPESATGRFLRTAYPLLILTALYSSIDALNGFGAAVTHDDLLQRIESGLFGGQPSRDWWRASPSDFWSTLLHAVYFSYYVIVPIPALYFLATRRAAALEQYLNAVIATFLACYICYMLFPVAGPYYEFARPAGQFINNGPARLVYRALSSGSAFGAAFPSSHVAATVAATVGAWFGSRRLAMILAVPTALLAVGVVYCQMHYVLDSVAGVVVGVTVPLMVIRRTA
ncbi:MAG: phosphatase PAP2 family protein [Gemmatimonadales bacterium]